MSPMVGRCVRISAAMSSSVDYLLVGHVSRDLTPEGPRLGGTVAFAGLAAQALGRKPGIITSAAADLDLSPLGDIPLRVQPATQTTTFENRYDDDGRRQQILHAQAAPLTADLYPHDWDWSPILHLAPIANEVDPAWVSRYSLTIGLTPQGWLRQWDADGRVFARDWPEAAAVLSKASAVVLSREDLRDEAQFNLFRRHCALLVLTDGARGCQVFWGSETPHIPAPAVTAVDPTGAGDIFAAAFFIRFAETSDAWRAAEFANEKAALSVTQTTLAAKIETLKMSEK
jgi:sugar/nucleoside kinase (ribokinase family)